MLHDRFDTSSLSARTLWTRRRRSRLSEFARGNGLAYEPEPGVRRPAAHIFGSASKRRHLDRLEVPGQRGFVVANYDETWDDGIGESYGFESGYVVFALRESYPHTLVARSMRSEIRALRGIEPVDGPAGTRLWSTSPEHPLLQHLLGSGVVERSRQMRRTEIEIVGTELFVLRRGFWRLTSPRLWRQLESVAEALGPFLESQDVEILGKVVAVRQPPLPPSPPTKKQAG